MNKKEILDAIINQEFRKLLQDIGVTNGEVIKAIFPNVEIIPDKYTPSVDLSVGGIMMMRVDSNWFNAKYNVESEK